MESGDLRIFRAVAEEGSITRAAQRLQYVPSNVTGRIRQLEEGLQTPEQPGDGADPGWRAPA